MEDNFESGTFCKVALTGLFAGIFATISCIFYDLLFCYYSGFPYSSIINISTIIFSITIVVFAAGLLYYFLTKAFRLGGIIFIITCILLTIYCLLKTASVQRSVDYHETVEFRQLLSGVLVITGISCFFLIPFLFNNKAFNKYVV